jgi:hypothetical protein
MRLVRLIYASALSENTDSSELAKIHQVALKMNPQFGLTGVLLFGEDYFLQCIEGGREAVNNLYCKILKDARHKQCLLLDYSEISVRSFYEWSMKLVLLTAEKSKSLGKFSIHPRFNPYELSGESAYQLLLCLGGAER